MVVSQGGKERNKASQAMQMKAITAASDMMTSVQLGFALAGAFT